MSNLFKSLATGGVTGSNMFNSFLHPEDAYRAAGNEVDQGWKSARGYEEPFWQHGNDQYGRLNDATGELLNPSELENKWASGYESSPYAKRMLQQNMGSGLDAASSMGLMGSSGALSNIQSGAGDIVAKDRQQYLHDMMEKYMTGIGLGKDLYNTGANMGARLGDQSMEYGNTKAGLRYGEEAAPGALFGKAIGTAANYFSPGSGNTFLK